MVTGVGIETVQGRIDGSDRENVDFGKQTDAGGGGGGSGEQIGETEETEMTCDVLKEKECVVVVDFDPAIIMINQIN